MKVSTMQMKKMLTSKNNFSQLGFNMLITRLTGMYKDSPTEKTLQ
jgi:hypothetical protein